MSAQGAQHDIPTTWTPLAIRVRVLLSQHRFDGSQHHARLGSVGAASNPQVIVRGREVEFLEEEVRHPMVVSVDENLLMALPELTAERAGLDELRASSDDGG